MYNISKQWSIIPPFPSTQNVKFKFSWVHWQGTAEKCLFCRPRQRIAYSLKVHTGYLPRFPFVPVVS